MEKLNKRERIPKKNFSKQILLLATYYILYKYNMERVFMLRRRALINKIMQS